MNVAVDVLGPVRLCVDGEERAIGGRRERAPARAARRDTGPARRRRPPGRRAVGRGAADGGDQLPPGRGLPSAALARPRRRGATRPCRLRAGRGARSTPPTSPRSPLASAAAASTPGRLDELTAAALALLARPAVRRPARRPHAGRRGHPARGGPARSRRGPGQALLDLGRPEEAQAMLAPLAGTTRSVSGSGRCSRSRSTAATGRPTPWRRCAPSARRSSRSWASIRRRRCATLEERTAGPGPGPGRAGCPPPAHVGHRAATGESGVVGRSGGARGIGEPWSALVESAQRRSAAAQRRGRHRQDHAGGRARRTAPRERGVDVLVGRCHEADLAPPYWPWLPVLRDLVASAVPTEPPRSTALLESAAPSTRPTPTTRARPPPPPAHLRRRDPPPRRDGPSAGRAAGGPALGRPDLAAAARLRRRGAALPAGAAGGHGPHRRPRPHPALAQALAALARLGAPPGAGAAARRRARSPSCVARSCRRARRRPWSTCSPAAPTATRSSCWRWRGCSSRPAAPPRRGRRLEVPDGIADVLRLRRAAARRATRARRSAPRRSSGRSFDPPVLSTALERPSLDDLDEALAAGLVEEQAEAGRYRFVHALTRETSTATCDRPAGRLARPGRRGRWPPGWPRTPSCRRGGAPPARRRAVPAREVGPRLEYGGRAALAAERRGAFEEAGRCGTARSSSSGRALSPDPAAPARPAARDWRPPGSGSVTCTACCGRPRRGGGAAQPRATTCGWPRRHQLPQLGGLALAGDG